MNTPEKYLGLLDAETRNYIDEVNACYPPDAADASIAEQRDLYNAMCEQFSAPRPKGVETTDELLDASSGDHQIALRWYEPEVSPSEAALVYVHGGGFVVGDLDSHDSICAELCDRTGLTTVAVDYRLSPENKHPAALLDTLDAINHAMEQNGRLILAGDSAGANLIAASVQTLRDAASGKEVIEPLETTLLTQETLDFIDGMVLIYPGLGGDRFRGSYLEHEFAPQLTLADVQFYEKVRIPGQLIPVAEAIAKNEGKDGLEFTAEQQLWLKSMGPLHDSDFTGLPPTVVFSAQCDPLHDDGMHYCERIKASDEQAQFFSEAGLVHGYLRARHSVGKARESFAKIVEAICLLDNNEFYD